MNLEEMLYAIRNLVNNQGGKIKTLEGLNQQLRVRNEGLCKRVEELESKDSHESMQCYKDTKRLTHERDEARAERDQARRTSKFNKESHLAAEAEVSRLEGLIVQAGSSETRTVHVHQALLDEAKRIRAQREEGSNA